MYDWYEKIKRWYPMLWSIQMVREAVEKGKLTPEEFQEITGEPYV